MPPRDRRPEDSPAHNFGEFLRDVVSGFGDDDDDRGGFGRPSRREYVVVWFRPGDEGNRQRRRYMARDARRALDKFDQEARRFGLGDAGIWAVRPIQD